MRFFGHGREIAQERAEAMDRGAIVGEFGAGVEGEQRAEKSL
jgi:hypothetical protein